MAVLRRTNKEHGMPGNAREMVTMAEHRFSVRVQNRCSPDGVGRRRGSGQGCTGCRRDACTGPPGLELISLTCVFSA